MTASSTLDGRELERRLRNGLEGTHDREPRPLVNLELPEYAEKLLTPAFLRILRPAAVLAPVVRRPEGLFMLLTRRTETLSSHKGQISFPGGRRDPEDPSAAHNALREAHEEIGLEPSRVEVIGYLDDYPTISRYRVTPVVGIVDGPVTPVIHEHEVAEVFEVPMDVLLDRRSFEKKSFLREGLTVPFYEVNYQGYRIWGATAGMLLDLCRKVTGVF
ncbi:MAG TPA: CoA pyrophosphatase [Nevskiaceae bacterium]|nr:CoA pyrophosphatase [Nevskiaceae bacterium]